MEGRLQGGPRPSQRPPVRLTVVAAAVFVAALAASALISGNEVRHHVAQSVAPAYLPVRPRLPVRHPACGDCLRAPCTRACELWLDRARGDGRCLSRVLRVAPTRD